MPAPPMLPAAIRSTVLLRISCAPSKSRSMWWMSPPTLSMVVEPMGLSISPSRKMPTGISDVPRMSISVGPKLWTMPNSRSISFALMSTVAAGEPSRSIGKISWTTRSVSDSFRIVTWSKACSTVTTPNAVEGTGTAERRPGDLTEVVRFEQGVSRVVVANVVHRHIIVGDDVPGTVTAVHGDTACGDDGPRHVDDQLRDWASAAAPRPSQIQSCVPTSNRIPNHRWRSATGQSIAS